MDFTAESILERLKDDLKNDSNKMEGGFTMDNLQAVSEELARFYETLILPLKEELDGKRYEECTSGNERHYTRWAKEVVNASNEKVVGNARTFGVRDGSGVVYVALISPKADVPDITAIQLVSEYINSQKPVGAKAIVSGAEEVKVSIKGMLELKEGSDINDINRAVRTKIEEYFVKIAFSRNETILNYFRIGSIVNSVDGVMDVIDYSINEVKDSIQAEYNQFFKLEGLVLNGG